MDQDGVKRANPYAGTGNSSSQKARLEPDARYCALATRIAGFDLRDEPWVSTLIQALAQDAEGAVAALNPDLVQGAFDTLLKYQNFELFAEVFTAYQDRMSRLAERDGTAFESVLQFKMDADWVVGDPAAMEEALQGLRIDRLEVNSPPYRAWLGEPEPLPVPRDACRCIGAMLGGTVGALSIQGGVADPEGLIAAIAQSRVHSLKLEIVGLFHGFPPTEWASYQGLLAGLPSCGALRHLNFHHDLEGAIAVVTALLEPGGPPLQSLALGLTDMHMLPAPGEARIALAGDSDDSSGSDITDDDTAQEPSAEASAEEPGVGEVEGPAGDGGEADNVPGVAVPPQQADADAAALRAAQLMRCIKGFDGLSRLKVGVGLRMDINRLQAVFLEPLQGHQQLASLDIRGSLHGDSHPSNTGALRQVIAFAAACPRLTRFSWSDGDAYDAVPAVKAFLLAGGKLRDPQAAALLEQDLASTPCRLEYLALAGVVLPTLELSVLLRSLGRPGTVLQHLDLQYCYLDLQSTQALDEVLGINRMLQSVKLSNRQQQYYLATEDGMVHGFGEGPYDSFSLQVARAGRGQDQHAIDSRAQSAFRAVQAHADALFLGLPARLAANRREVLTQVASQSALVRSMAMVLGAAAKGSDEGFKPAAAIVLQHLSRVREFSTAVRMNEVLRDADVHGQRDPAAPPLKPLPSVVALVRQDQAAKKARGGDS